MDNYKAKQAGSFNLHHGNRIKIFEESGVWYVRHMSFVFPFHDGTLEQAKLNAAMIAIGGKSSSATRGHRTRDEWNVSLDAIKTANYLNRVFRDNDPHASEKWAQEYCLSKLIEEQKIPWDDSGHVDWFKLEDELHDMMKTIFPLCSARVSK